MNEFGLYVHIPFCVKKCLYCDFLSKPCDNYIIDTYFNALIKEIEHKGKSFTAPLKTIYIGGGTPSLVDITYIDKLFNVINNTFKCNLNEITIEANPESLTESKLKTYKQLGINRLSIGIQSLNDDLLHTLGRSHNSKQGIKAIDNAKKYFNNINADIMLGLPNQTMVDIEQTLKILVDKNITHISAYGLIVEKNTKLYRLIEDKSLTIDEDLAVDMYDKVVNLLENSKFNRYEISNFALNGYECKHNYGYWNRANYLGVGASACSFIDGVRWSNVANITEYIKAVEMGNDYVENYEVVKKNDAQFETIMLSLRTVKGLNIEKFNIDYNLDFFKHYSNAINNNISYLTVNNGFLSVKSKYFYILNSILVDFLI